MCLKNEHKDLCSYTDLASCINLTVLQKYSNEFYTLTGYIPFLCGDNFERHQCTMNH